MNSKEKLIDDIKEIFKKETEDRISIKILPQSRNEMKKFEFDGKKIITVSITTEEKRIRFIVDFTNKEIEVITNLQNRKIVQQLEEVIKIMAKKEAMKNLY